LAAICDAARLLVKAVRAGLFWPPVQGGGAIIAAHPLQSPARRRTFRAHGIHEDDMREIYRSWLDDDDDDEEKGRQPDMPMSAGPVQNALFKSRTVLVFGEIDMRLAERVTAQITALAAENDKPIRLIINSPGGHVESGDTIHDMIRFCGVEVKAIGTGWVASAGAHIFLGAKKENRLCLPNTRFLLHQPAGGMRGQASDIQIEAEQIIKMRDRVNRMIAKETGQTVERIVKDTQRNFWMSAEEAVDYGIVSRIITDTAEV
jgi:ATP-dependent Clp protease protease subunit